MCCLFKNFICCLFRNSPLKPLILPDQIITSLSRTNVTNKDLKYKHKLSKWPIYFPPFISDFGTLKFFYVHSGYELNDKVRVYLCFFQINIFYYLNFYCQFKTKYWINMPIEVLTAKYLTGFKLKKRLTLHLHKHFISNGLKIHDWCQICHLQKHNVFQV